MENWMGIKEVEPVKYTYLFILTVHEINFQLGESDRHHSTEDFDKTATSFYAAKIEHLTSSNHIVLEVSLPSFNRQKKDRWWDPFLNLTR